MASHEGSRKRVKISRNESKPASSAMASASTLAPPANRGNASGSACSHEQSLKALNTDLDAMRQIITCKICHRLLYEPYSLACGHTYCYSCLSQWLIDSRKKTCPDCRAAVHQQPTPSYLVRELVLIFVSRNDLLPAGETIEEHNTYVKEEAEVVAKDKANTDPRTGGLFKGCFKRGFRGYIGPIHDAGDGVDRCPTCHWELEEGFCNQCGEMVEPHEHLGFSDYDDESDTTNDDIDHELDAEDAAAVFGADGQDDYFDNESVLDDGFIDSSPVIAQGFVDSSQGPRPRSPGNRNRNRNRHAYLGRNLLQIDLGSTNDFSSIDDEHESEAEEDEEEENLPGFVVDDDEIEYASSEDGEGTDVPVRRSNARRTMVVDSFRGRPSTASAEPTSEPDDDSEDEGPVALGSQRRKRGVPAGSLRRGRRTVSSDEESSEDDDDQAGTINDRGGFSPLDSNAADYSSSVHNSYDSDGVSTVHPMDDDDGYEGQIYHDETGEEDYESDGSASETGWGTRHETTRNHYRQHTSASSNRLPTFVDHNNHDVAALHAAMRRNASPSNGHRRPNFSVREPYSMHSAANNHSRQPGQSPMSTYYSNVVIPPVSQQFGMFRSQLGSMRRPSPRPRPGRTALPDHPFQLGNTLDNLNRHSAAMRRSYNETTHHIRSNPVHRAVAASSSRSGTGGGVSVGDPNSSGSSSALRAASTSGRRKRNLSISSDGSVEELGRRYAF